LIVSVVKPVGTGVPNVQQRIMMAGIVVPPKPHYDNHMTIRTTHLGAVLLCDRTCG